MPKGDGFSYVNLLNGVKTNPNGWGAEINKVYVTCCNLNGPMGLAYIPFVAVMSSASGPVINLYNDGEANAFTPHGKTLDLKIKTDFPASGNIAISVKPGASEKFSIRLRIPSWSKQTVLKLNGKKLDVKPGTYKEIEKVWSQNDRIELSLDMRCRIINAPKGSNREGDNFQALIRGPIVLARDENIDADYNKPVKIISKNGYVDVQTDSKGSSNPRLKVKVPTDKGFIPMVDYASVNSWDGKKVCTWLPTK